MMMEHLHHTWKLNRFLLLEMKQDQKHKLAQRSQHSFILFSLSFFLLFFFPFCFFIEKKNHLNVYTNPAAGSLRHKCYDHSEPNNCTTVQFFIMLQWSYHQMYYSPFKQNQEDSTSEKKVPQDIIIFSIDIYIHMYIYIHPITEIHTSLLKNIMFFPQSNTHIRTSSPGAYIYTIVFCCVCFFFLFRKKN